MPPRRWSRWHTRHSQISTQLTDPAKGWDRDHSRDRSDFRDLLLKGGSAPKDCKTNWRSVDHRCRQYAHRAISVNPEDAQGIRRVGPRLSPSPPTNLLRVLPTFRGASSGKGRERDPFKAPGRFPSARRGHKLSSTSARCFSFGISYSAALRMGGW